MMWPDAGERGGFARAGGTGHEHQALLQAGRAQDRLGDVEVLGIGQAERDHADDGGQRAALAEHVGTEAADAGQREGEVLVMVVEHQEALDRAAGDLVDGAHHGLGVLGHERGAVDALLAAAHAVGDG